MKCLFDICHPAHAHFFRNPIKQLIKQGHNVLVTSRDKEMAIELLDGFGLEHKALSSHRGKGLFSMARELIIRDYKLYGEARQFQPDVLAAIGGTFISHVGKLTGIPSIVFYDTENAGLQNAITYPFASLVVVPRCYNSWLPKNNLRYNGYHELSYLHPDYFTPDKMIAEQNGVAAEGKTFLLRLVSWQANHDIGEQGWEPDLIHKIIKRLSTSGKVLISSEYILPDDLEKYRYRGDVKDIHHVMAFCSAVIGESATMASEAAVLGVPALYIAHTGRGYTDEQEKLYGLVTNIFDLQWHIIQPALDKVLNTSTEHWYTARQALLADTIDVATFVTDCLKNPMEQLATYRNKASE